MTLRLLAFTLAILPALASRGAEPRSFPKPKGPAVEAGAVIRQALGEDGIAQRAAAEKAAELLPPPSPVGELLHSAMEQPEQRADLVRRVDEMLAFEPRAEAQLPEGFPTYTPVGVIEVKQYPKRRQAVAEEFFTLFRHITEKQIAMTTPVEMEFDQTTSGDLQQRNMAFYYGDVETGELGRQGEVDVVEDQPLTVLSLGARGSWNDDSIATASAALERWVASRPEYESAGPIRVMGYSSPMIPSSDRFYEVQLPIRNVIEAE